MQTGNPEAAHFTGEKKKKKDREDILVSGGGCVPAGACQLVSACLAYHRNIMVLYKKAEYKVPIPLCCISFLSSFVLLK